MLNAEHYKDPTATQAMKEVSKAQPITYFSKPAYVSPTHAQRVRHKSINIEDMSLEDIRPHVYNCAKSKMNLQTCTECNPGCVFGRRVIELLKQESNQTPVRSNKGPTKNRIRSMQEYQAAIASGDVFQYALEHAKSPDPKKAKAAAWARVNFWRKSYGALIKETPKPTQDPVSEEQPHLMQMPCLSKKVAAERAVAEKSTVEDKNVAKVFADKLASLHSELEDIRDQIGVLKSKEDAVKKQINTINETAAMLNIALK